MWVHEVMTLPSLSSTESHALFSAASGQLWLHLLVIKQKLEKLARKFNLPVAGKLGKAVSVHMRSFFLHLIHGNSKREKRP